MRGDRAPVLLGCFYGSGDQAALDFNCFVALVVFCFVGGSFVFIKIVLIKTHHQLFRHNFHVVPQKHGRRGFSVSNFKNPIMFGFGLFSSLCY